MQTLELVEVGDEIGLILSEELLVKLNLRLGDEVQLLETKNGFMLYSNKSKTSLPPE
jgi:hypothetical protein